MRPSFRVLTATFMASPSAQHFMQTHKFTPQQLAAHLIGQMDEAPNPKAADAVFKSAMASAGIYTDGVAAFNKGTEQMLRDMGSRDTTDRHAERMSAESRNTPVHWPKENIKFLRDASAQSSVTQGLADRFRSSDRQPGQFQRVGAPEHARASDSREDDLDLRGALQGAIGNVRPFDHARLPRAFEAEPMNSGDARADRFGAHIGLRDTIGAALDLHYGAAAIADPLSDERLLDLSDSV